MFASMLRTDGLSRLARLADRLSVPRGCVRVRPAGGGAVALSILVDGRTLSQTCGSQSTEHANFVCLVLWLTDLARNVERRIETLEEGFGAPPVRRAHACAAQNLYDGEMTVEVAASITFRAVERLGRSQRDLSVDWDVPANSARLRLQLPSGRVVEKTSTQQHDVRCNVAALALWLRSRARNYERGLEGDLDALFAANLLPAGPR